MNEINIAEYNSLRTELIHHDRTCLTIIGLLLTASTAIYSLVPKGHLDFLLIILSVIWLVGFLYILEKRSNIKRISVYIQTQIEPRFYSLGWERWSLNNRYKNDYHSNDDLFLPTRSPLKLEFLLLKIIYMVNCIWLCFLSANYFLNNNKLKNIIPEFIKNIIPEFNIVFAILAILVILSSFIISICYLECIVGKYYKFNKAYKEIF